LQIQNISRGEIDITSADPVVAARYVELTRGEDDHDIGKLFLVDV